MESCRLPDRAVSMFSKGVRSLVSSSYINEADANSIIAMFKQVKNDVSTGASVTAAAVAARYLMVNVLGKDIDRDEVANAFGIPPSRLYGAISVRVISTLKRATLTFMP